MRIEYYVTQELSARVEDPSRLSAPWLAIAYLNTWGLPPPPSALLTNILLTTKMIVDKYEKVDRRNEGWELHKFIFEKL